MFLIPIGLVGVFRATPFGLSALSESKQHLWLSEQSSGLFSYLFCKIINILFYIIFWGYWINKIKKAKENSESEFTTTWERNLQNELYSSGNSLEGYYPSGSSQPTVIRINKYVDEQIASGAITSAVDAYKLRSDLYDKEFRKSKQRFWWGLLFAVGITICGNLFVSALLSLVEGTSYWHLYYPIAFLSVIVLIIFIAFFCVNIPDDTENNK